MPTPREVCSDCGGAAHEIKVIDKSHQRTHAVPEYTLPEAKLSRWSGTYPTAGRITAYMCENCGRIAHFGIPNDQLA